MCINYVIYGVIPRCNAENVVVIRDETAVARAYQQEFERLWAEGTPLNSNY